MMKKTPCHMMLAKGDQSTWAKNLAKSRETGYDFGEKQGKKDLRCQLPPPKGGGLHLDSTATLQPLRVSSFGFIVRCIRAQ